MSVAGEIDQLRAALPACSLVVFGDLFSQITLCVSAREKHPQEQLDAICVTAGGLLDGPAAEQVANALGMPAGLRLARAVILSQDETQVIVRSSEEDADVLCCLGSAHLDVDQATEQAGLAFHQMSVL